MLKVASHSHFTLRILKCSASTVDDYIRYTSGMCSTRRYYYNISHRIYFVRALEEGILRLQSLDNTPSDCSGSSD
jgi:hypothetical protein